MACWPSVLPHPLSEGESNWTSFLPRESRFCQSDQILCQVPQYSPSSSSQHARTSRTGTLSTAHISTPARPHAHPAPEAARIRRKKDGVGRGGMGWGADCVPFLISHCPDERQVCMLAGNWSVPMEIGLPEACRGKRSGLWHCHGLTRHPRWAGHGFLVACISSRALAPNEMGLLRFLPTSLSHSSCGCKSSRDGAHRRQPRHSAFVPS